MDAANFLNVRQRRSNPLPMEEERLVEDRLIGQELVPIIPMTPAAELSVDSGALEVNEGSVGSRPNGGPHPLGAEGDDSRHRGGDQQEVTTGARLATVLDGEGHGGRRVHDQELPLSDDQGHRGVHDSGIPVLPQGDGRAWPGGPMAMRPTSLGPSTHGDQGWEDAGGSYQPLFNLEQLGRFQELYEAAPNVYGKVMQREVSRPTFLEKEEEELHRRLAAIQEEKRLREVQEGKSKAMNQDVENDGILKKVLEENSKLKEMIWELKRRTPDRSQQSMQFETPDQGEATTRLRTASMEASRPEGASKPEGVSGPEDWMKRGASRKSDEGDTMRFMMTMLDGMQRLLLEREGARSHGGMENVKAMVELPKLVDWSNDTGPIDLGDWLATIAPYMEDLSDGATLWWSTLMSEANQWYDEHMALSPLDRLSHEVKPSGALGLEKWSRLERRASAMLMGAIPPTIREEIVSARSVSALGIITRLLTIYQPGGLAEKALILSSLENPKEEGTLPGAVQALRRWIRWRRRATDVRVSIPDPTVLMRGLTKLTKKVMAANPELQFRVSLARNTLLVDSIPTHTTVSQLADHILAEMEQVAHQERKRDVGGDPGKLKEVKQFENGGDGGKGKGKDGKGKDRSGKGGDRQLQAGGSGNGGDIKCRFYLSDSGCRKGRECNFSHDQTDGKKRCFACGSLDHYAPSCPRTTTSTAGATSGGSSNGSPGKPRAAKATEEGPKEETSRPPSEHGGGSSTDGETVQQLLTEANRMLKSLGRDRIPEVSHGDRMRALQQQLDELKEKSVKTLRLTRITNVNVKGLIDSGATHPMRGIMKNEKVSNYKTVEVTLASGQTEQLLMTPGGVMVAEKVNINDVEPIVPFGTLVSKMNCTVLWEKDGLKINHPTRGLLEVEVINGCPQVSKKLALQLINEIERLETDFIRYHSCKGLTWDARLEERAWLRSLVHSHPAFRGLPCHLLEKLVITPEENVLELPGNRRARKVWRRDGCILHLYAGENVDYTFARAMKEVSGTSRNVLEIDIKRGEGHDMRRTSCYGALLRLALDGHVRAVIGGPNCRTRSVLRTYPGGPPQTRHWDGGEFGDEGIPLEEQEKIDHDDEMMWKMVLIYLVAKAARKVRYGEREGRVNFLLEQPAPPWYRPEVVSFWWTSQWEELQRREGLRLLEVNQGDYGGAAVKPTGLGTDLDLEPGRLEGKARSRPEDGSGDSKALARWAPGLMKAIALAVCKEIKVKLSQRAIKWEEHLRAGHVPFHRDCRICQEAAARDRPHRRLKHPRAGVLSLDLAGPLRKEKDHVGPKKYILV